MMKKTIYFISMIMVASLLFLNACGQSDNWDYVDIEGYGSIKVPASWTACAINEYIYFSSEESGASSNILVQYRSDESINEYFADIENMTWLQDENLSNGACITKYNINHQDGSSEELFALYFTGPDDYKSTEFLCLDDSLSEETLRKIAKSYSVSG